MSRDLIIGVDAGTSVIKAVAFDLDGDQLAVDRPAQHLCRPARAAASSRTWRGPGPTRRRCCASSATQVPDLARRTAALAVTGQGDGTWLIDTDGDPVGAGLALARLARGRHRRRAAIATPAYAPRLRATPAPA